MSDKLQEVMLKKLGEYQHEVASAATARDKAVAKFEAAASKLRGLEDILQEAGMDTSGPVEPVVPQTPAAAVTPAPTKRGRPKGSKNTPKDEPGSLNPVLDATSEPEEETTEEEETPPPAKTPPPPPGRRRPPVASPAGMGE